MEFLESFVAFTNDILWSYVLIVMLVGLGIWFSLRTRFVQVRCLKEMVRLLKEGVGQKTEHNHISSFQAFCVSTASRVGVGNIAGIAIAIVSGGPGAIFWMWIIAILGSATGFIESTLAQIYKVPREGGGYRGGPAYYIKNVLGNKPMAALFAVLISVTFGLIFNSVQANTITISLQAAFGLDRFVMGCIIAALTGIVIFGGVASSGILKSAGQRIFVERFGAAPQLVVCGGGHVGASVVRLAKLLGLPVTALEDRPEFAEELRQAGADAVLCLPFAEGLAQISGGQETYFVVVTRAHSCDIACLRSILQKPAAYVGMMGSRKRAALVHTQLAELGLPQERIDALHAPIGLSIGAKTAQEIALSILAEIVSVKNSRQQTEGFSPVLLAALEQQTAPAVLATIVGRHGSTPREEGSKMLVLPDGSAVGSVGGGIMEYRTQKLARELLEPGAAPCRLAAFTTEGASDAAAIAACGGSMEVFLQRVEPEG